MFQLPLHQWHVAHGATMTERDGWQVPDLQPTDRGRVAITDLSAGVKVSLRGPGVAELTGIQRVGSVTSLPSTVLSCRLTNDQLLLLSATPTLEMQFAGMDLRVSARDWGCRQLSSSILQVNVTCALAQFTLTGNDLEEVLRSLTSFEVSTSAFLPGSCAQTGLAGIHAVLIRPPQTKEMRICLAADLAEYVWERLKVIPAVSGRRA
jgi:glycine cleavage system aminomethyltransferase T